MPPEARAVLFDLDNTLYSLDRFVLSGFVEVCAHLEQIYGVKYRAALAVLVDAFHRARGRELQCLVAHFALPVSLIPSLVDLVRAHRPRLRLPATSREALAELRETWLVGVVTNGLPDIQARKVDALGLAGVVDTVVYAHAVGSRLGKPDPAAFIEAAARLRVPVARTVFVGDDPGADVCGAARVGMRTIHVTRGAAVPCGAGAADATVRSLAEVPAVAERLMDRTRRAHVS